VFSGRWSRRVRTCCILVETQIVQVLIGVIGLIFRDHRPVHWSPSSRTALAEAELEYDDKHACTAAFVKMPFLSLPKALQDKGVTQKYANALIWTTTPWTLPANKAIAFNKTIEYAVVQLLGPNTSQPKDEYLLAKNRIDHVLSFLPEGTEVKYIVDSIYGSELEDGNASCSNVFQKQDHRSPFISADFVTATSGTGLVHMAPGHGMEDYQVCQKYGIGPAFAPVDDEGRFTAEAFPAHVALPEAYTGDLQSPSLTGLFAEKEGAQKVLEILGDSGNLYADTSLLLVAHKFTHKNPIDWRTKKPVITRATAQWFADVSLIKDRALAAIEDVKFVPESGRNRLKAFIEGRSQWCISRQRAWGVPIPALYHKETGEACITDASINHIISVVQERGTDTWFSDAADDPIWLHSSLEPGQWIRGRDTMDVWFDSGTTWTSLAPREEGRALADVYVEGSDQHRGWFQSSLLTAIATQDPQSKPLAPYATLLTHGFILDGEGRKMSKSIGNTISPAEIVSGSLLQQQPKAKPGKNGKVPVEPVKSKKKQDSLGPDLLRLWVASSDYTKDVPISQQGLLGIQQALQKYRVTLKFLCGVLQDYEPPSKNTPPPSSSSESTPFATQMILSQLARTSASVFTSYANYRFHEGVREINSFVNTDLSAFYFEIAKDLLYTGTQAQRSQVQDVLHTILRETLHWLAPITPHLVQELCEHLPAPLAEELDPFKRSWEGPFVDGADADSMSASIEAFGNLSRAVKLAQEEARSAGKLGSGLACRVVITGRANVENQTRRLISNIPGRESELASLLVVSEVETVWTEEGKEAESSSAMETVLDDGGEADSFSEWCFEEPVWLTGYHFRYEQSNVKVKVLPPRMSKCVRCWQYTAEDGETPCGRCQTALAEKGIQV
jgi:isoleucyl-tRNA synthetase